MCGKFESSPEGAAWVFSALLPYSPIYTNPSLYNPAAMYTLWHTDVYIFIYLYMYLVKYMHIKMRSI